MVVAVYLNQSIYCGCCSLLESVNFLWELEFIRIGAFIIVVAVNLEL